MGNGKRTMVILFILLGSLSCSRDMADVDGADAAELTGTLVRLWEERRQRAFQPGMGIAESLILERLGRLEESVCAAFLEMEYQYSVGMLSREEVMEGLEVLKTRVSDGESARAVLGLEAYMLGEYAEAAAFLACGETFASCRYYYLAGILRSGGYTMDDLAEYGTLEPQFRNFGPYYTHLWKTMKAGEGEYSIGTAGAVLEKSIFLNGRREVKAEVAEELARLYGD